MVKENNTILDENLMVTNENGMSNKESKSMKLNETTNKMDNIIGNENSM